MLAPDDGPPSTTLNEISPAFGQLLSSGEVCLLGGDYIVQAGDSCAMLPSRSIGDQPDLGITQSTVYSPQTDTVKPASLKADTGVRSHSPLPLYEMCTHCRQPIGILLARQPANHKLITICWNLEWGTL